MTPGGPPSVPANDMQNGTSNSNNSNSPQHQQNILNSASNIMNSPQSLMNSPQNMMNSPQNMNQNMQQNLMNSIPNLTDVDLNFDPAAVIDGEGGNDLNVNLFNNDELDKVFINLFPFCSYFLIMWT